MDRRSFLGFGGAALAGLALPKSLRAQACPAPTTEDYYRRGPFYLPGAPDRVRLALPDEPGKPLSIRGTVADCAGPAPGVSLEVWHATDAGCYIYPGRACADHGNPEVSRLWARLTSDAEGKFGFETIIPGVYLNGSSYRPSHIHFRIRRAASARSEAVDLSTQLYFAGDPYLEGDAGSGAPEAKARIIPLASSGDSWTGEFPVYLPGGSTGLGHRRDALADPALRSYDLFVQRSGDRFRVFLPPVPAGTQVEARVYDAAGSLVRRSLHASPPIELDAALWPGGAYLARFNWPTDKGPRNEAVTLRK